MGDFQNEDCPGTPSGGAGEGERGGLRLDRRGFLQAAAGGALGLATWGLQTGAAVAQQAQAHTLKLGAFELTVLSDGFISFPTSNLAPAIPEAERNALLSAHGLSLEEHVSKINVAMVRSGDELILIDTGAGMNFVASAGLLADSFDAAGIDREEVTKVILTHAHPDHVWGIIDDFDESERFPNASYVMGSAEWDFWMAEDVLTKLPDDLHGFALGAQRSLGPIAEKITRVGDGASVSSGITMIDTPGHTPGHMSVVLESEGETLVVTGDAATHMAVSFERPDWRFIRDQEPDVAVATRKKLLDMIATDKMGLIGYHLPWPGVGRAERKDTAFRYVAADA